MSKVATKRSSTSDSTGRSSPPATLTSRLVLAGLSVVLSALSCFSWHRPGWLAGWSVGPSTPQQLHGAAFPLLALVLLGACGIVCVAREVTGRSSFSPWLLAGTLPAVMQVLALIFDRTRDRCNVEMRQPFSARRDRALRGECGVRNQRHERSRDGPFARQDIRAVLARFGISSAKRGVGPDPTEEVILLHRHDFKRIDTHEVTTAIMDVWPETKVLVIQEDPAWEAEPL